MESSDYTMGPN